MRQRNRLHAPFSNTIWEFPISLLQVLKTRRDVWSLQEGEDGML